MMGMFESTLPKLNVLKVPVERSSQSHVEFLWASLKPRNEKNAVSNDFHCVGPSAGFHSK
jgi:hypothetical protein